MSPRKPQYRPKKKSPLPKPPNPARLYKDGIDKAKKSGSKEVPLTEFAVRFTISGIEIALYIIIPIIVGYFIGSSYGKMGTLVGLFAGAVIGLVLAVRMALKMTL